MNCKWFKKNLVNLLEDRLPKGQREKMENHLLSCPDCSRLREELSPLWEALFHRDKIQTSPYFWTRLNRRIIEYEEGRKPVPGRIEGLFGWTRKALAVAALAICIFLGHSLGNFPQSNGHAVSQPDKRTLAIQQVVNSHYLNPLSGLPSGSIEATYLNLFSGE
jgi:hypothetical protein